MQCDRAQEFFSDYLERTLDRPMTVALEAHLAGCSGCREEIESLGDVFGALSAMPQAEPPADGAWQVVCRVRQAQAEQWETERRRAPGFLQWLRSLNPASAAMGAGLATLVVAGGFWFTAPGHVKNLILPGLGGTARPESAAPASGADAPAVLVAYGPLTAGGQQISLQVQPEVDLPDAHVEVAGGDMAYKLVGDGSITRSRPMDLPLNAPVNSGPLTYRVLVESRTVGKQFRYLVVVPTGEQKDRPVTLAFPYQSLEESLRQLAPSLAHPVVVESPVEGNVQLQVESRPASTCLRDLAAQLRAEVTEDRGVYRMTPAR